MNWTSLLLDQLGFYWEYQARPRLEGLTDDEYLWEPVPGMWSIRRRAEATTSRTFGSGPLVMEVEIPEPTPAPMTTIAWRLGHVSVEVFGMRNADHFGARPIDASNVQWPGTAAEALALLDETCATWMDGVRQMDTARLGDPVGPAEGPFAADPYAALILHIHRETIHHLAEVALLRDLYAAQH